MKRSTLIKPTTIPHFEFRSLLPILIVLLVWQQGIAQDYQLGKINFEASGDEVAMPYFEKGMLLLHNFEYVDAIREFEMAQLLDPGCVMSFWGEAMCYDQPLWQQQDYEKAKGALFKLGVTAAERLEKASTEVEKGFFAAIEMLFGPKGDIIERRQKYLDAMAALYVEFPAQQEVAAFYALAIMGHSIASENTDKLKTAGRVLTKLNAENPQHPGALNYMIHLYDAPDLAYKGRKAADAYFELAKDSKYALYAPSRIYMASGAWLQYVACNEAAQKAAGAWAKKNRIPLGDREYHSLWWLQYGYLQQARYAEALKLLMNLDLDSHYSESVRIRFHLAMMRGHYLVESGNWQNDIARLSIQTHGFNVSMKNMCFFIDGMIALEKNDFQRVDWYLNQMTDQRMVEENKKEVFNDFRTYSAHAVQRTKGLEQELMKAEILEWELRAIRALKAGNLTEAERFIVKAVELEDQTDYDPGPPVVLKPAHEIYGEILLAMNNSNKAIEQYDLAMKRAPGRSLCLLGKWKALRNLGQNQKAAQIKAMLMENWKNADKQALMQLQ
jgi:hypothetical protein